MKLRRIIEGREIIDNGQLSPFDGKMWILVDPSVKLLLKTLDTMKRKSKLGGWIAKHGTWIWDRDQATHAHIARVMAIKRDAIAFYIAPGDYINDILVSVDLEVSEWSSDSKYYELISQPLIKSLLDALLIRHDRLTGSEDYDTNDIMNQITGRDY